MNVRDDINNGKFSEKASFKDSRGTIWTYKYNTELRTAILSPESVSSKEYYPGIIEKKVISAVNPVPEDMLIIPEIINGYLVVGIDSYSFYETAKNSFSWPPKRLYSKVKIPTSVQYIGAFAFANCDELNEVEDDLNAEIIDKAAFSGCNNMQYVNFSKRVEIINVGAFSSCHNLEYIGFSEGLKTIGGIAFSDCPRLRQVDLPDSVVNVACDAFIGSNCRITYPEKLGFGFAPSTRWRIRTSSELKRGIFNLLNRESLLSPSRYE